MLCVPRFSGAAGQSKKVMSVPGLASAVGVEQVIGADVVLVDGLLDQPQAERCGIELQVAGRVGGDGGEMMDAGELHDVASSRLGVSSRRYSIGYQRATLCREVIDEPSRKDALHHRRVARHRARDRAARRARRRQHRHRRQDREPHPKLAGTIYTAAEEIEKAGGKALPLVGRRARRRRR